MTGGADVVEHDPAWADRFGRERDRLLGTLGRIADGGVVWSVEHVGATSVPGLPARPELDVQADVHPFPLGTEEVARLWRLGYRRVGEGSDDRHLYATPDGVRLELRGEPGDAWADAVVWRDHLRADARTARGYAELRRSLAGDPEAYAAGKRGFLEAHLPAARASHVSRTGWAPVVAAAAELEGLGCPWALASGWALDLFAGEPSRYHHDLDVSVYRRDQLVLRERLIDRGWMPHVVRDGRYEPWPDGARLELPVCQVHAWRGGEFLDVLFSETRLGTDGIERWSWRRRPEVTRDLQRVILPSSLGVPVLGPEVVLLFKSRSGGGDPRRRDEADFDRVVERLEPEPRGWLRAALERHAPGHPWLGRL